MLHGVRLSLTGSLHSPHAPQDKHHAHACPHSFRHRRPRLGPAPHVAATGRRARAPAGAAALRASDQVLTSARARGSCPSHCAQGGTGDGAGHVGRHAAGAGGKGPCQHHHAATGHLCGPARALPRGRELHGPAPCRRHCRTAARICRRAAPGGRIALVDLYQEDGSFHGDNDAKGVQHFGFAPRPCRRWPSRPG